MATELHRILKEYAAFEKTVRKQIAAVCAPQCSICKSVCCGAEFCRENLDSPFLRQISSKGHPERAFLKGRGWLTSTGCALSIGRPPVCYQFNCNKIIDDLPDDRQRYLFKVLSNLVPYVGKRLLGARHLVEIMDPVQLKKVKLERFARRLTEAREALDAVQSYSRSGSLEASSLSILSKIVAMPRSLTVKDFNRSKS